MPGLKVINRHFITAAKKLFSFLSSLKTAIPLLVITIMVTIGGTLFPQPDLFKTKLCNVSVERESELTMGHTAVDFWHVTDKPRNVHWAYEVDADGFYDLLTERLARFS